MTNKRIMQREVTSKRILDAALNEFAGKGYSQARLSDIADKAGVAYGLLSQRFGSKEFLYNTVLNDAFFEIFADISSSDPIYLILSQIVDILKKQIKQNDENLILIMEVIHGYDIPESSKHFLYDLFARIGIIGLVKTAIDEGYLIEGEPYDVLLLLIKTARDIISCFGENTANIPDNGEIVRVITTKKGRKAKANVSGDEIAGAKEYLLNAHDFVCTIDISKKTYKHIYANPMFFSYWKPTYNYDKDMKTIETSIANEFRSKYQLVSSVEGLKKYMADENRRELTLKFRGNADKWFRCHFAVMERTAGIPEKVLMYLDVLDMFTSEVLSKEKKMKDSSAIIEDCINLFSKESDVDKAINDLMQMLLDYYAADKAYFCEVDERNFSITNFYEKRLPGVKIGMREFVDSSPQVLDSWLRVIKNAKELNVTNVISSPLYDDIYLRKTIKEGGINSLMVNAFEEGGKISGFLGVDNSKDNFNDPMLLRAVSAIVRSELSRKYRLDVKNAETNSVIAGLAGNFEEIVYVEYQDDPNADTMDVYRTSETIANQIPGWRTTLEVKKRFGLMAKYLIHPDDVERFFADTKKRAVTKGMTEASAYIVSFRAVIGGEIKNYQMRFVPIDKESDEIKGYVLGINNVDNELNVEMEQERERRRISDVIKALAVDYESVYYYNPQEGKVLEYALSDKIDLSGVDIVGQPLEVASENFMKVGVLESEHEDFRKAISLDNIRNKLSNSKVFSMIYLSKNNRYCEMKVAKVSDESDAFVFGFALKDTEIRGARRQDDALHEAINILCEENNNVGAINSLMTVAADYYEADKVAIYELTRAGTRLTRTYEFVSNEAKSAFSAPQEISSSDTAWIVAGMKNATGPIRFTKESLQVQSLGKLNEYNFDNVIFVPLKVDDDIVGFMAIVNCKNAFEDDLIYRISAAFALHELLIRKQSDEESVILNEIAASYMIVGYIDFLEQSMHLHRSKLNADEELIDVISYNGFVDRCMNEAMVDEDKPRFKIMTTPEYVMNQFEKKDTVVIGFVCKPEDERRNYEMRFIKGNAEGTKAIVTIEDNTEIIKHENEVRTQLNEAKNQAEAANRAKSEFLSRMSHDIRTPINGVIGMTAIAKKYKNDQEKVKDCLDKIDTASHHLLSLLNDVLDMSRIESGKLSIVNNPMNIIDFANTCYTIIAGQLEDRHIDFEREYDKFSHVEVLGDELHLRQAVINILGNAVKFTPDGGTIRFTVKELECGDEDIKLRITISDTGRGMKPGFISHIWEPFSQENTGTRTTYAGTGLGMPITKQLIEMMGGVVSVESTLGEGTTFTVDISLKINTDVSPVKKTRNTARIKGSNILLAEDNEINIEIASELLKSKGATVTVAENGKEALETFINSEIGEFDLILMDIMMPVLDGLEATKAIRELERPDAKTIPIIAMTANAFDEDINKSRDAGMDAHLSKPIQVPVMLKTISYYLKERK